MSSIVPSSASDRKKLKAMLVQITDCLARIEGEREAMKDIVSKAEEEFGIKKKIISKLAKTMFKHDYSSLMEENSHFESLYEILVEGKLHSVAQDQDSEEEDEEPTDETANAA